MLVSSLNDVTAKKIPKTRERNFFMPYYQKILGEKSISKFSSLILEVWMVGTIIRIKW